MLVDGCDILLDPLAELFGLVYITNQIPEQWLIVKTIILIKKDEKGTLKIIGQLQTCAVAQKYLKN